MAKPAKNSAGLDAYFEHYYFQVNEQINKLDLQSAGSSPNLTYTKISALDAIRIP